MDLTVVVNTEELADLEAFDRKVTDLKENVAYCDRAAAAHYKQVHFF